MSILMLVPPFTAIPKFSSQTHPPAVPKGNVNSLAVLVTFAVFQKLR